MNVLEYTYLVQKIAHHMIGTLPANVCLDDLVQNGMIGLLDAAQKYVQSDSASFTTYATHRIRGAIIDGLRHDDWAPRRSRQATKEIEECIRKVSYVLGRLPDSSEIAQHMEIPLEELHSRLDRAKGIQLVALEDLSHESGESFLDSHMTDQKNPLELLEDANFRESVVAAIENLKPRDQTVLSLYYVETLNLKEIGEIIGVSESRVSQILTAITLKLRSMLDV